MALLLRSIYTATLLSLAYVAVLYQGHPARRLPLPPIMVAFAAGLLAMVPVVVVRSIAPPAASSMVSVAIHAAWEEGIKFAALCLLIRGWREPELTEPLDVAMYFAVLGVGFGVFEQVWYVLGSGQGGWLQGDPVRFREAFRFAVAARSMPSHMLFGALAGGVIGHARFASARGMRLLLGVAALGVGAASHIGFDAVAQRGGTLALLAYLVALLGALIAWRRWAWDRSAFRAIIDVAERGAAWTGDRPAEAVRLLLAEGFGWPGRTGSDLLRVYPMALSVAILYPLLFGVVYSIAWGIAALLARA